MSYVSVFNFFMLMYLVLDKLKLSKFTIPGVIICIALAVTFGYIEDRIGLAREEMTLQSRRMGLLKEED